MQSLFSFFYTQRLHRQDERTTVHMATPPPNKKLTYPSRILAAPPPIRKKKYINTTSWEQQMWGGTTWEDLQTQSQKSFKGVFFQERHSHRALGEAQALPPATLSLPLTEAEAEVAATFPAGHFAGGVSKTAFATFPKNRYRRFWGGEAATFRYLCATSDRKKTWAVPLGTWRSLELRKKISEGVREQ